MKHKFTINLSIVWAKRWKKLWFLLQKFAWGLGLCLVGWLLVTTIALFVAARQPVDAFFVLGGSIRREIYVAQLAKKHPEIPILVSHGSQDPCIWLIFQREAADLQGVWLENCANSTFDNFYYGLPILQRWKVHKVKLITSQTHLPRAKWMAQIIFGSHGIWVETDIVKEKGVPGNRESWFKTVLDIIRSLTWAVASQIVQPTCSNVTRLVDIDMPTWEKRSYVCEHQGGLKELKIKN
ncbi:MAG TPA: YdcF family protein [Nostocaceae cyanobacterium]|nr:YdcF family protein [Nostocaceae cyanobacterium]